VIVDLSKVIDVHETLSLEIQDCLLVARKFQTINASASFKFSYSVGIAEKSVNNGLYEILIF
jgi:hypothetical protein